MHDMQGVKKLIQLIFNKAQPKRVQNSIVTGPVLAALVTAYVGAINNGAVPTIATAWQVACSSLPIFMQCSQSWCYKCHLLCFCIMPQSKTVDACCSG